jgi:hypothetical protein
MIEAGKHRAYEFVALRFGKRRLEAGGSIFALGQRLSGHVDNVQQRGDAEH